MAVESSVTKNRVNSGFVLPIISSLSEILRSNKFGFLDAENPRPLSDSFEDEAEVKVSVSIDAQDLWTLVGHHRC